MLEEHGLPSLVVGFALASLFTLVLFKFNLHLRSFGVLFCVDGVGDARPEKKGLVWELLLLRGEDLGGNIERFDIDNGELLFKRNRALFKDQCASESLGFKYLQTVEGQE